MGKNMSITVCSDIQASNARPSIRRRNADCTFQNYCAIIYFACYVVADQMIFHDDVIKWKHFPRYWQFVRGVHRSPVNSPHKGQWREALTFSLICVWINGWVNNREAGELRRYRAQYDVIIMFSTWLTDDILWNLAPSRELGPMGKNSIKI